ncbi:MAG TPA: hypothetical protein GYA08_15725, partial [Chloroflexi bacterium]|nr:hypothetical protein [Chloroflexota bacterium]
AMRARFIAGCQRPAPEGPGMSEAQARTLWEQVEPFAGYGFNQGHATAYADVSYRSAYVRAHWPAAFLCARLANWGGFHHPAIYIAEAQRLGIDVRPPHVNFSQGEFTLVQEDACAVLYMGLNQVRDLRQASVQAIIAERRRAGFTDLADLLRRVALQRKEIEHLIQCGALDGLGASRAALLAQAEGDLQQFAFDFMAQQVTPEGAAQRLAWEAHILGHPVSVHPLDVQPDAATDCTALVDVTRLPRQPVKVAGTRLPGWTGGKGFFLGDRTHFCIAVPPRGVSNPPAWAVVRIRGRWLEDEWGSGWLQIEQMEQVG